MNWTPDAVIIRLGELTLKGRNRHRFERRVLQQLEPYAAKHPAVRLRTEFGRIHMELRGAPYTEAAEALNRIFGLHSYSPALQADPELDSIREAALRLMLDITTSDRTAATFKVAVKRANKRFPYDSKELPGLVGGYILQHTNGLKVDVHNPDVTLTVDIREDAVYVFTDVVKGAGGFPAGTNGKALLLLSGGIDSPVAGWLSMRMGLELEAVHFHSYPYTSERAQRKVEELTRALAHYSGTMKLHLVPFTDIQVKLKEEGRDNLMLILMKRAMLRIAEQLAVRRHAGGLVTGESLGQVASQTLSSLDTIGRAVQLPILRPLIMMDKAEIVKVSEAIGTFEISVQPYEDCCTLFHPLSVSTNPSTRVVESVERRTVGLGELLERAVEKTVTLTVGLQEARDTDELF